MTMDIGGAHGFDAGTQLADWTARLENGLAEIGEVEGKVAQATGLDQVGAGIEKKLAAGLETLESGLGKLGSGLEHLIETPSPLDKLAGTDTAAKPAAPTGAEAHHAAEGAQVAAPHPQSAAQSQAHPNAAAPGLAQDDAPAAKPAGAPTEVSAKGVKFIAAKEGERGSNRLQDPGYGSGVTLGYGYDIGGKSKAEVIGDLTRAGVAKATAAKVAQGVGLRGDAVHEFVHANWDVVDLSPAQQHKLLAGELKASAAQVHDMVKVPLTQNQFDALTSLVFNVGAGAVKEASLLKYLNNGDYKTAAERFMRFDKSGGEVVTGLQTRRGEEMALFNAKDGPASKDTATTAPAQARADTAAPAHAAKAGSAAAPAEASSATKAGKVAPGEAKTAADFAKVIEGQGDKQAQADLAAGHKVLLGIRHETQVSKEHRLGVFDDRLAVVWKAPDGQYRAETFTFNTEPNYKHRQGADVDGKPGGELGRLATGSMRFEPKPGGYVGAPAFKATHLEAVERDLNHDLKLNNADGPNRVFRTNDIMYIHRADSAHNTSSAGCQTVPRGEYDAFMEQMNGVKEFSYVLVNDK